MQLLLAGGVVVVRHGEVRGIVGHGRRERSAAVVFTDHHGGRDLRRAHSPAGTPVGRLGDLIYVGLACALQRVGDLAEFDRPGLSQRPGAVRFGGHRCARRHGCQREGRTLALGPRITLAQCLLGLQLLLAGGVVTVLDNKA